VDADLSILGSYNGRFEESSFGPNEVPRLDLSRVMRAIDGEPDEDAVDTCVFGLGEFDPAQLVAMRCLEPQLEAASDNLRGPVDAGRLALGSGNWEMGNSDCDCSARLSNATSSTRASEASTSTKLPTNSGIWKSSRRHWKI
jgi:hypothetical protein